MVYNNIIVMHESQQLTSVPHAKLRLMYQRAAQIAGFTTRSGDYDTVFAVVAPDPADRIASAGVEVLAGAPVCLQHCATSALLCLEAAKYPNEFGSERELSFKTVRPNGKKLLLVHEQHGNLTGTLASKQPAANQFCFVVGSTVQELPAPKCAHPCVCASPVHELQLKLSHARSNTDRLDGATARWLAADRPSIGHVYATHCIRVCVHAARTIACCA